MPVQKKAVPVSKNKFADIREKLRKRQEHSYQHRDDFSGRRDIYDTGKMSDLGVKFWRPKAGVHRFDIIPYYAGSQHPMLEQGDPDYMLDLRVHRNIGVNQDTVVCLTSYNRACPVCELIRAAKTNPEDYPDVDVDSKSPSNILDKRICIYNVIPLDKGEEQTLRIMQIAHFCMEKHLAAISRDSDTGEEIHYVDPEIGKSIIFERKGDGMTNTQYFGHRFGNRTKTYDMSIMDKAFKLDELINVPTYEEVKALLEGDAYESATPEEEDDVPNFKSKGDDEEEAAEEEGGEEELECPYGGTFATDFNMYDECDNCDLRDDCEAAGSGDDEEEPAEEQEEEEEESEEAEEEEEEEEPAPKKTVRGTTAARPPKAPVKPTSKAPAKPVKKPVAKPIGKTAAKAPAKPTKRPLPRR